MDKNSTKIVYVAGAGAQRVWRALANSVWVYDDEKDARRTAAMLSEKGCCRVIIEELPAEGGPTEARKGDPL